MMASLLVSVCFHVLISSTTNNVKTFAGGQAHRCCRPRHQKLATTHHGCGTYDHSAVVLLRHSQSFSWLVSSHIPVSSPKYIQFIASKSSPTNFSLFPFHAIYFVVERICLRSAMVRADSKHTIIEWMSKQHTP